MTFFSEPLEFIWDKGNQDKNWQKHEVTIKEAEEVFFDTQKLLFHDQKHSEKEERFIILGKTETQRFLFVAFTLRKEKIRIISARDGDHKERGLYEKTINLAKVQE